MTMGHFTEKALEKFNSMCSEGFNFGENPVYDFARCITSSGKIYGISDDEQCHVGKKISNEAAKSRGKIDSRMAKLKKAFIQKTGREMRPAEIKKAENMLASIGIPIPAGQSAEDMLQKLLPKGAKVVPVKTA